MQTEDARNNPSVVIPEEEVSNIQVETLGSEQVSQPSQTNDTAALSFPDSGYIGIAAKFAEVFSQCYETPKIFFYSDFPSRRGHLNPVQAWLTRNVEVSFNPAAKVCPDVD